MGSFSNELTHVTSNNLLFPRSGLSNSDPINHVAFVQSAFLQFFSSFNIIESDVK